MGLLCSYGASALFSVAPQASAVTSEEACNTTAQYLIMTFKVNILQRVSLQ